MAKKTYYAATHYYGVNVVNDYSTLYRFDNKTSRDEFVEIDDTKRETMTYAQARKAFPRAFATTAYHTRTDARDWIEHHDNCTWAYWCPTNIYYSNN